MPDLPAIKYNPPGGSGSGADISEISERLADAASTAASKIGGAANKSFDFIRENSIKSLTLVKSKINSSGGGGSGDKPKKKKKITKADIRAPDANNFVYDLFIIILHINIFFFCSHLAHIGYDPEHGFDVSAPHLI